MCRSQAAVIRAAGHDERLPLFAMATALPVLDGGHGGQEPGPPTIAARTTIGTSDVARRRHEPAGAAQNLGARMPEQPRPGRPTAPRPQASGARPRASAAQPGHEVRVRAPRGQALDAELARGSARCAPARAGPAEPVVAPAPSAVSCAPCPSVRHIVEQHRRVEEKPVDPVENASVPGDDMPGVLVPTAPLQR